MITDLLDVGGYSKKNTTSSLISYCQDFSLQLSFSSHYVWRWCWLLLSWLGCTVSAVGIMTNTWCCCWVTGLTCALQVMRDQKYLSLTCVSCKKKINTIAWYELFFLGACGLLAVCIFGANGDNRDWMPYWQHNDLSWSFAFACIGSILLVPAGCLFLVEARRTRYRRFGNSHPPSQYSMGMGMQPSAPSPTEHKPSAPHHTDI